MKPVDLLSPGSKSGYRHVGKSTGPKPYQAVVRYAAGLSGSRAVGPRRATALESAQDYCDYINNKGAVAPATPALKSAGHAGKRASLSDDPEVQAALGVLRDAKGQRQGKQGFVYLIAETMYDGATVDLLRGYGKIGYSTNPQARVAELQTGNPRKLRLMGTIPGTEADERAMQKKYINQNVLQEWFRLTAALHSEFTDRKDATP